MSDKNFIAELIEQHPAMPVFCSVEAASPWTGHKATMIRRNIASHPELARKSGRQLLVNLPLYLFMLDSLPRANLTVTPDRPGTFARAAAAQAEAAAKRRLPAPRVHSAPRGRPREIATA